MTSWLYLSAEGLSEPSAQWPCCLVTESGEQLALTLAEAAPKLQGQAVGLVLPMEMCGWLQAETWPSRRRPDVRTVAYSIEEQLCEDLETLHLCLAPRDRLGRYGLWVVNRQRFAQVLALMPPLGITLALVQVDADRYPMTRPMACGGWAAGSSVVRCPRGLHCRRLNWRCSGRGCPKSPAGSRTVIRRCMGRARRDSRSTCCKASLRAGIGGFPGPRRDSRA